MLAQYGLKKPAVARALDALADAGKLTAKARGEGWEGGRAGCGCVACGVPPCLPQASP